MITGLQKEHVKVDMTCFGETVGNTCYGCAATNAICEISGKVYTKDNIEDLGDRAKFLSTDFSFLCKLEIAYDYLRSKDFDDYNKWAKEYNFATIPYKFRKQIGDNIESLETTTYKISLPRWQEVCDQIKDDGY